MVAGSHNLESSYFLSKHKTIETFPLLKQNNLKASMIYHDGQSNDSKLNVAIALTAAAHGADVSNYVTVNSLVKKDGVVKGAIVEDSMTGEKWEIKAKVTFFFLFFFGLPLFLPLFFSFLFFSFL